MMATDFESAYQRLDEAAEFMCETRYQMSHRSAALLIRQGLEAGLWTFLCAQDELGDRTSFKSQFLIFNHYLWVFEQTETEIPDAVRDIHWTWVALSRASHVHGYPLPPVLMEVQRWERSVRVFLDWVQLHYCTPCKLPERGHTRSVWE